MARQQARDLRQRGETPLGRRRFAEQRTAELAQEEDCRDFTGFVGIFPIPEAGGV